MNKPFKILLLILIIAFTGCNAEQKSCKSEKNCLASINNNLKEDKIKEAVISYDKYIGFKGKEDYCPLLNIAIKANQNLYEEKTVANQTKGILSVINGFYEKVGMPIISEKLKVKETLQGIDSQNKMLKLLAALNLYQANSKKYMDKVLPLLKDPSPVVRGSMLVIIGYTRDKKYIPEVKKAYEKDSVLFVRNYALKALFYMNPESYKTAMEEKLKTGTPLAKTMAAGCLLNYKPEEASKIINESLYSKQELIVARALEGMAEANMIVNKEKVISLLDDKGPIVAIRAAQAIGSSHDPGFIAILKRKLNNDEDPASKLNISTGLLMLDDTSGLEYIKKNLYSDNVVEIIFASQAIIDYCSRNKFCKL